MCIIYKLFLKGKGSTNDSVKKYKSLILIWIEPENLWVSVPFWTITHAITHAALW